MGERKLTIRADEATAARFSRAQKSLGADTQAETLRLVLIELEQHEAPRRHLGFALYLLGRCRTHVYGDLSKEIVRFVDRVAGDPDR